MARNPYADYVLDLLSPLGGVALRAMFGGHGVYRDGIMFGIVADDQLYFKVDEKTCADYQARGSEPFTYAARGKEIRLSYWRVPEDVMEDTDELHIFANRAGEVARLAQLEKPRRRKAR